ncbi:MAG TPA: hypothetical protein VFI79_09850 [Gemmatimonadales bacterium]|nr:hypothetical protein [Gemmatimonadales bacterium]
MLTSSRPPLAVMALAAIAVASVAGAESTPISTHQATTHVMRYHLALPVGWSARHAWPVLVVVPDAKREFEANLARFVAARGARPYILVAPEVLSCGGARTRTADQYAYTPAEWARLGGGDDFAFDEAGVAAVLSDVHGHWNGEARAFLTGWEAGGHTVWALALRHPERWRGVAPVTPNYQRRGLAPAAFSRNADRATLPIQPLRCATADPALLRFTDQQTALALNDARSHGFRPQPVRVVAGTQHGPLPDAVLAWCDSLRGARP